MAEAAGRPTVELIGNDEALQAIAPEAFVTETIGLPTLTDILSELRAPGQDPRPPFRVATFKEGLDDLADLKPGMILEGVVTNVATFGAFVDIGVHQDGLVHVSRLADRFVKDPHEVVKAGDIVRVKVLEVDIERKRIALTMRFEKKPAAVAARMQAPRTPRDAGANRQARRGKPAPAQPQQRRAADAVGGDRDGRRLLAAAQEDLTRGRAVHDPRLAPWRDRCSPSRRPSLRSRHVWIESAYSQASTWPSSGR